MSSLKWPGDRAILGPVLFFFSLDLTGPPLSSQAFLWAAYTRSAGMWHYWTYFSTTNESAFNLLVLPLLPPASFSGDAGKELVTKGKHYKTISCFYMHTPQNDVLSRKGNVSSHPHESIQIGKTSLILRVVLNKIQNTEFCILSLPKQVLQVSKSAYFRTLVSVCSLELSQRATELNRLVLQAKWNTATGQWACHQ